MKHKSPQKNFSLQHTLQTSNFIIVCILIIPAVYSIILFRIYTRQYDSIITNVSRANEVNQIVKTKITHELWDIVSGWKKFNDGNQYEVLAEIKNGVNEMLKGSTDKTNVQQLELASRTVETLYKNVNELGVQMAQGSSVSHNERALDEIRSITALLSEILQDFVVSEIEGAAVTNEHIKHMALIFTVLQLVILVLVIALALTRLRQLMESVRQPVADMERLSSRIAEGDLTARVEPPHIRELQHLAENLNTMAARIHGLIEQNIAEQKNLQKAELKALQAQITPHFLYNTFDTIIWLAEAEQIDDVIKVTTAFSEFLRISLSRGHEWITVQQEISHVRHYLTIQKIRYESILNYTITVDERLDNFQMLKLSLQPLVENAIYHGIKNKRGRGHLQVHAQLVPATNADEIPHMRFAIEDNGIGFTKEKLEQVYATLHQEADAEHLTDVYGLYNVNKRLILYYNSESDGLHIQSEAGKGTTVWFTVPCRIADGESNV